MFKAEGQLSRDQPASLPMLSVGCEIVVTLHMSVADNDVVYPVCFEVLGEELDTFGVILRDSLYPHISSEHRNVKIHLLNVRMIW